MNPQEAKFKIDFSSSFEQKKQSWLDETERDFLRDLFLKLPKEEQEKVLEKYENLKTEPEKSFFDSLRKQMDELKWEIESSKNVEWLSSLKEKFKNNEAMKEFIDIVWSYIDLKLDSSFSPIEKEVIKLTIFWEIQKLIDINKIWNLVIDKLFSPLKKLLSVFSNSKKSQEKSSKNYSLMDNKSEGINSQSFSEIKEEFDSISINFWVNSISEIIDEKVEKLNYQKWKKKFETIDSVLSITSPDDIWKITKESIIKDAQKIAITLEKWAKLWNDIKWGLNKLPFWLWEDIIWWFKDIAKSSPILWFILWLFLGKDFLSEESTSNSKSLKNLESFSSKQEFPLKWIIDTEDIKDLDPSKLEIFFDFIWSKEWINPNSDTFWEELLTWKTKNSEIKKIYKLLTKDWKINNILSWDELKWDVLNNFIDKLNSLSNLEETKTKKSLDKDYKNAESLEEKQEIEFRKSVLNINNLPAEVIYKWEKIFLDIKNNKIILWDKEFSIKVMTSYWDKFEKIEFRAWYFYLNWDNKIPRNEIKNLILELKENNKFLYKWFVNKFLVWRVDYDLIIS